MTVSPGGSDCLSFAALSPSATRNVYKYLEQRTLNFVTPAVFLILTLFASFLRAVSKKSLISLICFGCVRSNKKHLVSFAREDSSARARRRRLDPKTHPRDQRARAFALVASKSRDFARANVRDRISIHHPLSSVAVAIPHLSLHTNARIHSRATRDR